MEFLAISSTMARPCLIHIFHLTPRFFLQTVCVPVFMCLEVKGQLYAVSSLLLLYMGSGD